MWIKCAYRSFSLTPFGLLLLACILVLLSFDIFSQVKTYQVINSDNIGIGGVLIASKKIYTISDSVGFFSLHDFTLADTLYFTHINYESQTFAVIDLPKLIRLKSVSTALESLTVEAGKWPILEFAAMQDKRTFTSQTIAFAGAQTTADLLNFSGEVSVQKSQQGGGSPMLRGFAANRILLVLDGVKMNNGIYRSGNLHNIISVDNQSLEQLDLLFGASSLLYGSGALGGTISLKTVTPTFTSLKMNSQIRYSYNNQERTSHLDFNLGHKRLASFTSFTWSDFDNLRAGKHRRNGSADFGKTLFFVEMHGSDTVINNSQSELQIFSGYRQWNILQKLRYKFNPKHELAYTFHYTSSSKIPRYDQLQRHKDGIPHFAEWFYGPQRWQFHQIRTKHRIINTWIDELEISLAYQRLDEDRFDRRFQSGLLRKRFEDLYSLSFNSNLKKKIANHMFTAGLEGIYNRIESKAFRANIKTGERLATPSRYPDGGSDYYSFGLHFNQLWQIRQRASLKTGLRYDHILIYTNFKRLSLPFANFEVNTGAWAGGVQYIYNPHSWVFKLGLSTAFRAPNVDDIAKVFESGEGVMVVPNPNLNSEYSYQFEGSIRKSWSFLSLDVVAFYNHLEGLMVRRNFIFQGQSTLIFNGETNLVQAIVNAGQAYVWGFTARVDWTLAPSLHWLSTFTFLEGKDKVNQVALRHVAPPFGKTTWLWQQKTWQISLNVQYSSGIPFESLAPSEQHKPYLYDVGGALPWWVLNFKAQFSIETFTFLGALENLLDRHYRPYSSGISAGGRSFSLSLKWKFDQPFNKLQN